MRHIHSPIYYQTHRGRIITRETERGRLRLASLITGTVFVVEVIGAFLTNSLALLGDAGHMLTHLMALFISLAASITASMPPTKTKTFGFYRLEILAALFNAATLFLITLWIFNKGYQRLLQPEEVESGQMFLVACIGLIANISCALILWEGSDGSLNIRSAFLHMLGDTFSSLCVVLGAIVIYYKNWYFIDPGLAMFLCLFIMIWVYTLTREAVDILLEATPKEVDPHKVIEALVQLDGIKDVHDIHLWVITSGMYAISAHVVVEDIMVSRTLPILDRINHLLRDKFKISHTVIQFETKVEEKGE